MKRLLLACSLLLSCVVYSQTTYYWIGENNDSLNVISNWNTVANGTGSARPSNTNATDILIFDGVNLGGLPFTVGSTGAISCAQMKYINGANVNMTRTTSGTTVITVAGDSGDDFFVDATSRAGFTSTIGSMRFDMAVTCTGKVNGEMSTITSQQFRITNTTTGPQGTFIFTGGSRFYTNITGSSSYAFGSGSQASEKWVTFEAGSQLYYEGGNSPHGSGSGFSAINMRPGSIWHHRATNTVTTAGNFFNRKSYGDIIVENNATLNASGPVYQIENLAVTTGSTFTTSTSGQTVVFGNVVVDGILTSPAGGSNELMLAGSAPQSISGSGTINISSLIVAANADINLSKDINLENAATVYGKLSFNTNRLTGTATFRTSGANAPAAATANVAAGSYFISGNAGILTSQRGWNISGTGIAPNTSIVSFSATGDSVYLSQPTTAAGTAVTLTVASNEATLQTANTNGFDPATGSVGLTGTQTFQNGINYIINAATTWPFGITTASTGTPINARFIEINAPVTVNRGIIISDHLGVNGKLTLRPLDIVHVMTGATINGVFNSSNYIATGYNSGTGEQSLLQYDGIASAITLPIGTGNYYLPVTVNPVSSSDFTATVFEGITANGAVNGAPLTPVQKQSVVNAVWNINRTSGSGFSDLQLGWDATLEGSTFTTLPGTDIGIITNTGSSWSVPLNTGDNTANTAAATVSSFGSFSIGAVPPSVPFIFNTLPIKTYGDADFNGGAISLNTTQPIIYSSSNNAVATIVAGNIHITGAGTADITASQASDGFYPAASITQTLTVNPAALTITADNKLKFEGQANPVLTATYTGFVLNETPAALLTPAVLSTIAVTASPASTYPITVNGATSNNYTISFVNGILTVQPRLTQTITFAAPATRTYGNADFAHGAISNNTTIPVVVASSNTNVATIVGNNIHIVGAGTSTITASQAGNAGYFPATNVVRTLTVNKAALGIRVRDTLKVEGDVNPPFTITYTGFVLSETPASLLTPVTATTTATTTSPAGYYPITLAGATSNNYTITYTNARLTVQLRSGNTKQNLFAYQPNNNTLTVRVFSIEPGLADIILYDLNGKPLMKKNIFLPAGFVDGNLAISTLPSGIYVVTVKGNGVNLKKTIPIIKQ
jgi:trimeric autotransporter adhesin